MCVNKYLPLHLAALKLKNADGPAVVELLLARGASEAAVLKTLEDLFTEDKVRLKEWARVFKVLGLPAGAKPGGCRSTPS